ncbi:hypothetical protein ACSVDE_02340 [Pseudalkalibacillus sp. Hm43]|uniref:hypothetical protein n=1 Tax=Pseudalkalibacillus sp. Hm43 TaxID=3450742 RepID=UPI003F432028
MEREKQIKIFVVFVVGALVVSLIMNFTLFSKINQVENQVNSISNMQYNISDNVNDQAYQIIGVLDEMQAEQSWITPIRMDLDPNEVVGDQAEATFQWQVKELQKDSEVVFHYTYGDDEKYKALPAEETQQGLFQVKVPIKLDMGPMWHVGYMNETAESQQVTSEKEMEEQMLEETLKFYVTVSYGDMVKSGKVHTEHLGDFGSHLYGTLQTDVLMNDENFSIMLFNHHADSPSAGIEEAYLLKYKDGTLSDKEKFEVDEQYDPADPMMNAFKLDKVKKVKDMRLVVQVTYNNGRTFEKEVYNDGN